MARGALDPWVAVGAAALTLTAVGHLLFVDASLAWGVGRVVEVTPDPAVLDLARQTTLSWGPFGATGLYRANSG